jgi:hypothetical protein
MGKAHQIQKENSSTKSETNALATREINLSIESKLLLYKAVLKPIWAY